MRHLDYSYDYFNIYLPLLDLGLQVELFDFLTALRSSSHAQMNADFRALVDATQPDAVLVVPTTDEFTTETIAYVSSCCPTLAYFHDDVWRADYAMLWSRFYRYIVSTNPRGVAHFASHGVFNVIYSPRGYNTLLYMPDPAMEQDIDVSFVGGFSPVRMWLIDRLRQRGIDVQVFGAGWNTAGFIPLLKERARKELRSRRFAVARLRSGYVTQQEMISTFQRSKVNLNLSNSTCWDARYLLSSPLSLLDTMRSPKTHEQIKGRHFELCGCGAFQLSYFVEGLETCFRLGEEIETYLDPDALIEKVEYYLAHPAERQAIADAGLRRARTEHSIAERLRDVFVAIGLSVPTAPALPDPVVPPGGRQ